MKLSEIRPCDSCGGKIAPVFYVIRMSPAVVNSSAVNQILGLNQYFGGNALDLAEAMSPEPEVVKIAMDEKEHKQLTVELRICQDCYIKPISLAQLAEKRAAVIDERDES